MNIFDSLSFSLSLSLLECVWTSVCVEWVHLSVGRFVYKFVFLHLNAVWEKEREGERERGGWILLKILFNCEWRSVILVNGARRKLDILYSPIVRSRQVHCCLIIFISSWFTLKNLVSWHIRFNDYRSRGWFKLNNIPDVFTEFQRTLKVVKKYDKCNYYEVNE